MTGANHTRLSDALHPLGRRPMLGLAAAAAAAGLTATRLWAAAANTTPGAFAIRLCDLTLPATDTPGAVAAGVPAFLPVALQHHLYGAAGDELDRVQAALDRIVGPSFMAVPALQQAAALARLDRDVFVLADPSATAWGRVKSIILAGYYGSKIGGSQEQLYELVPGRYDPDIPSPAGSRDYSSDWAGVAFR